MRFSAIFGLSFATLLSCWALTPAGAQDGQAISNADESPGLTSDVRDPVVELRVIRQKRDQQTPAEEFSLFRTSPLTPLRERGIQAEKWIYESTDIKLGTNFNTLMQGLSDEIPGEDDYGMATFMSFVTTWDGFRKGECNQGEITLGLEARWNWGTTDPVTLGSQGLGSLGFTANPFGTYTPTFLLESLAHAEASTETSGTERTPQPGSADRAFVG